MSYEIAHQSTRSMYVMESNHRQKRIFILGFTYKTQFERSGRQVENR